MFLAGEWKSELSKRQKGGEGRYTAANRGKARRLVAVEHPESLKQHRDAVGKGQQADEDEEQGDNRLHRTKHSLNGIGLGQVKNHHALLAWQNMQWFPPIRCQSGRQVGLKTALQQGVTKELPLIGLLHNWQVALLEPP
jgi:hypothetical protein